MLLVTPPAEKDYSRLGDFSLRLSDLTTKHTFRYERYQNSGRVQRFVRCCYYIPQL